METTPFGMTRLVMPQNVNAYCPIFVTLPGMLTLPSFEQLEKVALAMLRTLLGIVTLVSALQLPKASSPMVVTLSGITTLVSEIHDLKASTPTVTTVCGIEKSPLLPHGNCSKVSSA